MLSNTLRAARPLRTRLPTLTSRNRAQVSALGIPRPGNGAITPSFQTILRIPMSTKPPLQPNKIDKEFEKAAAQKILEARPEEVTTTSSVRMLAEHGNPAPPADEGSSGVEALQDDLNTIKETFALRSVPRGPFALGLAGTLPYLATSVSTVFLSWNLNTELPTQSNFINSWIFSHEGAAQWLQVVEPIQVGYGAVIISFLGAMHWGMELAEKTPVLDRTRFRYGVGVLAPAVAWPSIFMPIEWALMTQFVAFCGLYSVDSHATFKGWTPPWYGTYRFVLTAVVGTAIIISLVGRYKVGRVDHRPTDVRLKDQMKVKSSEKYKERDWAKEEEEERKRLKEEKKREEERKRKEEEEKAKEEEKKAKEEEKKAKDEKKKDKSEEKKEPAKADGGDEKEVQGGKGQKEGATSMEKKDDDQKKDRARKEGGVKAEENLGGGEKKSDESEEY